MTDKAQLSLPDPDPAALERSAAIVDLLEQAIGADPRDAIGFDRFMEIALYTPGLGYYTGGGAIFGAAGDFVTAPESGELFGACLARQCAQILGTTAPYIVEYGAGSGALAGQLLNALGPGETGLRYHIVETSAALADQQQAYLTQTCPDLVDRVTWSRTHLEHGFEGIVIANEVVDALPARRYRWTGERFVELGVTRERNGFTWRTLEVEHAEPSLPDRDQIRDMAPGFVLELTRDLDTWLAGIRTVLARGTVLLVDYGEPRHERLHEARAGGTLQCHYRHHVHADPFLWPGLQDITVSVDFTQLAELAVAAGFDVAGYCSQASFLLGCGIETVYAEARGGGGAHDYSLAQEAKRLLLPGQMGERFKVMALNVDYDAPMPGFTHDERHRLDGPAA